MTILRSYPTVQLAVCCNKLTGCVEGALSSMHSGWMRAGSVGGTASHAWPHRVGAATDAESLLLLLKSKQHSTGLDHTAQPDCFRSLSTTYWCCMGWSCMCSGVRHRVIRMAIARCHRIHSTSVSPTGSPIARSQLQGSLLQGVTSTATGNVHVDGAVIEW